MRVALDIQHAGKPRSPRDRGAQLGTVTEVWATRRLALACEEALDAAGHEVYAIRDGEYRDRHQRVNALRPDVYVSWHLDAGIGGRGDRGAVFHWPGSTTGSATAARIVAACQPIVPWPLAVKAAQAGKRHGMIKRSNDFLRSARGTSVLADSDAKKVISQYLPYAK